MTHKSPSDFDDIVAESHPRKGTLAELDRRISAGFEMPAFVEPVDELAKLRAENAALKARIERLLAKIREHIGISENGVKLEIWG